MLKHGNKQRREPQIARILEPLQTQLLKPQIAQDYGTTTDAALGTTDCTRLWNHRLHKIGTDLHRRLVVACGEKRNHEQHEFHEAL